MLRARITVNILPAASLAVSGLCCDFLVGLSLAGKLSAMPGKMQILEMS